MMKKIIFLIITFIAFISPIYALEIESQRAVMYNMNDSSIVYEKNKDEKTSIASLTKIMTALVAIENTKDFTASYVVDTSSFSDFKEVGAYMIGLKNGQKVTINDLMYGTLLASGADAARSLAISVSGDEEKFIELMNKKAQELNLTNTHFSGTVGLDDEKHYSTVNEVALLLTYALKNSKFYEVFTTDSYTFSDKSLTVKSSMRTTANGYHLDSSFILGGKTGFTQNAGRCLASIAYDQANDIKYLLITTNASKVPNHVSDAINLYQYYFENYKYQDLVAKNETIVTLNTKYSKTKKVAIPSPSKVQKYLPNDYNKKDVKLDYEGIKTITPTMAKGKKLGNLKVYYQKELVKNIPITLNKTIKFSFIGFILCYKYLFIGIFVIIIIGILLLCKRKTKVTS